MEKQIIQSGGFGISALLGLIKNIYEMTLTWVELKDIAFLFEELVSNAFVEGGSYQIYSLLSIINRIENPKDIYSKKVSIDEAWLNLNLDFVDKRNEIELNNLLSPFILKRKQLIEENREMLSLGITDIHTSSNLNDLFYLYKLMQVKDKNKFSININNNDYILSLINSYNTKLNKQFNRNNNEEMGIMQNILFNSYDDKISFNGNILFVNELEISLNNLSESDSENSILLNIDENKKKLEDVISEEDRQKITSLSSQENFKFVIKEANILGSTDKIINFKNYNPNNSLIIDKILEIITKDDFSFEPLPIFKEKFLFENRGNNIKSGKAYGYIVIKNKKYEEFRESLSELKPTDSFCEKYAHHDVKLVKKYYNKLINENKVNKNQKNVNKMIDEVNKINIKNLKQISNLNKINFLSSCFPEFKFERDNLLKEKRYTKEVFEELIKNNDKITFHEEYKNTALIETSKTLKLILEKLRKLADLFSMWLGKYKNEFDNDDDDLDEEDEKSLSSSIKSLNKENAKIVLKIAKGGIFSFSKINNIFSQKEFDDNSKGVKMLKMFIAILMAKTWTRELNRNLQIYQMGVTQWNNEFSFHQLSRLNSQGSDKFKKIDFKEQSKIIFDKMPRLIPLGMKNPWSKSFNFYSLDAVNNLGTSLLLIGGNNNIYKIIYS